MFFQRMNIGTRLHLGFSAILLILVSLAAFAAFEVHQLSNQTVALFEHPLAVSNATLRTNANVIKIHRSMKDIVLAMELDVVEDLLNSINLLENEVFEDFEVIEKKFLGPKEQVDKALNEFILWQEIRGEVVDLVIKGEYGKAGQITMNQGAEHVEKVERSIEALSVFAGHYAATLIADAKSTRDDTVFTLILLTVFSFACSVFAANRLTVSITQPLAFLKTATESIGLDSLGMRIGIFSNDEVGDLMVAFNRMAGDLQSSSAVLNGEIERRKKIEDDLLENEQHLKDAQRVAKLGYWRIDLETDKVDASEELCRIFGCRSDERALEAFTNNIHPDDRDAVLDRINNPEPAEIEYRLLLTNGTLKWVHVQIEVITSDEGKTVTLAGTAQDVTDRRSAENALVESERRFRSIVESTPLGFIQYEMSPEGELLLEHANKAAEEILELDSSKLLGKSVEEALPVLMNTEIADRFGDFRLHQKSSFFESFRVEIENRTIYLNIHMFPTGPGSMAALFQDVTQQKMDAEAQDHREQLERLVAGISTRFVDSSSGDIKNGIDSALADLGQFAKVDLCYLILYSQDGVFLSVAHEWCAQGVSSLAQRRQNLSVSLLPWVQDKNRRESVLYIPEINNLPAGAEAEKQRWLKQGLRSVLVVPLLSSSGIIGHLNLETLHTSMSLQDDDLIMLKTIGEVISRVIERQKAERLLQESNAKYQQLYQEFQTILHGIPDRICLWSSHQDIVWSNHESSDVPGGSLDADTMLHCFGTAQREETVCHECNVQKCFLGGEEVGTVVRYQRQIYGVKCFPLKDDAGTVNGVISLSSDITEKMALRDEAERANRLASLGELSAGIAHEINNPNALIMLNAPIISEAIASALPVLEAFYREQGDFKLGRINFSRMRDELPRLQGDIEQSARKISNIVNELKQHVSEEQPLMVDEINLNDVVDKVVRLVTKTTDVTSDSIEVTYCDDLPVVKGNAQRIGQVLINLLVNAAQSLPSSDLKILVDIKHDAQAGKNIVEVVDNGCGIEPDNLLRVKEPLFSTKRGVGGTGLGLSVSDRIVKEHSGVLELASELGQGTIARIALPCLVSTSKELK